MNLEIGKVYKVLSSDKSETFMTGDVLFLDPRDNMLVNATARGWLEPGEYEDLLPDLLLEEDMRYYLDVHGDRCGIRARAMIEKM